MNHRKSVPRTRLLRVGAVGFAVEFGWAIGEAIIIPYLQYLGLRLSLAGLVYISNPLVAVILQPVLGYWTVKSTLSCGPLRPLIVALSTVGLMGLFTVTFSRQFAHAGGRYDMGVLIASFIGFGLADISHDCILGPLRALVSGVVLPHQMPQAHAIASFVQMSGRFVGLAISILPVDYMFPFLTADPHIQSMLLLNMVALVVMCTVTVTSVRMEHALSEQDVRQPLLVNSNLGGSEAGKSSDDDNGDDDESSGIDSQPDTDDLGEYSPWGCIKLFPAPILALLCTVFVGWVGIMSQAFYWTLWVGLDSRFGGTTFRISFVSLAASAGVSLLSAVSLPSINRRFGAGRVLMASELLFMLCMMATWLVHPDNRPWAATLIAAVMGLPYVVHNNNPFLLCEYYIKDPKRRGLYTAFVNNAMTLAQIFTAAVAGYSISALNDSVNTFFAIVGVVGVVCDLGILFVFWRYGMLKPLTWSHPTAEPILEPEEREDSDGGHITLCKPAASQEELHSTSSEPGFLRDESCMALLDGDWPVLEHGSCSDLRLDTGDHAVVDLGREVL